MILICAICVICGLNSRRCRSLSLNYRHGFFRRQRELQKLHVIVRHCEMLLPCFTIGDQQSPSRTKGRGSSTRVCILFQTSEISVTVPIPPRKAI